MFERFKIFKKDKIPSDLSKIETKHINILVKSESPTEVGELLRKAAIAGSGDAAAFMSQILSNVIDLKGNEVGVKILNDYLFFTELAAKSGCEVSQANLAKHYLKEAVDPDGNMDEAGYEKLKNVEYWLKKAAAQGFKPSIRLLVELDELFQWGRQAFDKSAFDPSEIL